MKINKIKVIENPVDEFQLTSESMNALLGGSYCGIRTGNHCIEYKTSVSCEGKENYCNDFKW